MKLDKWPEEVEVDGWVWAKRYLSIRDTNDTLTYIRKEKLHVPPTMREIMEHLLNGGWVRHADYSNADYYYKMAATGELEYCFKRHGSNITEPWKEKQSGIISRYIGALHQFHLIQPGEWFEGEEK
jgi:hypothetical protein